MKTIKPRVLWSDVPVTFNETQAGNMQQESQQWAQSVFPLGNGRLGCTVFGEPKRERLQFNEDSLWVGNEDCTGGYQPFGDLYVDLSHETFDNYRRELDISRAVQTVTYTSGGVAYKREYFSSHPAQVMVFRFTASAKGALSGRVTLGNVHEIASTADGHTLTMQGNTESLFFWQLQLKEREKRLVAGREYASDKIIDLDFEAQVRVLNEGGTIACDGDAIVFKQCDNLTILLGADTNYLNQRAEGWRGEHPRARICAQLAAAESQPYEELLSVHVADYQRLYGRFALTVGSSPMALLAASTADRVATYRAQLEQDGYATDRDLETLVYQYARYLMLSCSRPGEGALPANLQGLWLYRIRPAWRCDYHTDVNVQMNYWFVDQANIPECFVPLAEWIDSIRDVRKEETRKVLGVDRGWLMRSENGVFGGSTWHFQKGDSAWLCQNLWDHYTFTQDRNYLEHYAYPVMREISEFWIDHLKALPDGTLVAPEGRSPEHGPVGVDGVTYDQSLCWDLFTNTIEASEVLDADEALRAELTEKRSRLLGPTIGRWGQMQEWMEDIDDPEDDHRHVNHLIGVYPGRQIHPSIDPEIAKAAKVGLTARRDHGPEHPGWSRIWKASMFARLLDGEAAYGQLASTLGARILGNLWAVHPPFQIDANFGYAAALNEMLVQSHLQLPIDDCRLADSPGAEIACEACCYVIHLLPALPEAWGDGSVRGMRVRGGFEVDMTWQDGALTQAEIRNVASVDGRCVIRHGDETRMVDIASDGAWSMV